MTTQEKEKIIERIRSIILNKNLIYNQEEPDPEMAEIYSAFNFLGNCISENNFFLEQISKGKLDATAPPRHNLLAVGLKELHAGLKHLIWQTEQITKGDYHQRVNFLGDFSDSINTMIVQLEERETNLKKKATELEQSEHLLVSIIDASKDWVVVIDKQTGNVIYTNKAAQTELFENIETSRPCSDNCEMIKFLKQNTTVTQSNSIELECANHNRVSQIKSFPISWHGADAVVNLIVDITRIRNKEKELEGMAYKDTLTGLFNRRFCLNTLSSMLNGDIVFSLCFIDADNLKIVNDTLGHKSGDAYLKSISHFLKAGIRRQDVLCRLGGDEFVAILYNCTKDQADERIDKIRTQIIQASKEFSMSISYGNIQINPPKKTSPETILEQADILMYQYKKQNKQRKTGENT